MIVSQDIPATYMVSLNANNLISLLYKVKMIYYQLLFSNAAMSQDNFSWIIIYLQFLDKVHQKDQQKLYQHSI